MYRRPHENAPAIDAARLSTLLNELRLPAIKVLWPDFAKRADKEGWPAARFLSAIADTNSANAIAAASNAILPRRDCHRERRSPALTSTPYRWSPRRRCWRAPPAIALIESGWWVLFMRTTELVQKLQVARREFQLESAIAKVDKFDLLILDDLAYMTKD